MATVKTSTDVFEKRGKALRGRLERMQKLCLASLNKLHHMMVMKALAGPTEPSLKIKKIVDETKAGYEAEGRFPMDTRPTSIAASLQVTFQRR